MKSEPRGHFEKRCRERGILETDPTLLKNGLKWAVKNSRGDLVEKVLQHDGADHYRFRCPDGIFYAVFRDGIEYPLTVYDREMMGNVKDSRKKRSRKGREERRYKKKYHVS